MKKRFGKQILCYLLSLSLFTSVLQLPARGAEASPYNQTETSEIISRTVTAGEMEKSLGFACNGGNFAEGYQAPDCYPVQELPDETVINKPGYAFAGWYDNKDFVGEAVTTVSDIDHTGPVVLYAKWTDPYYYVDIPAVAVTDGSEIKLSAEADGLYDQEYVNVSIHSDNDWKLKNNDSTLSYQLKEKDTSMALLNDTSVLYLSPSRKSEEKIYVCEVKEEPKAAGQYKDTLTFQIYKKLIDGIIAFSRGWMDIHNSQMNEDVTDLLTPLEFSIAMLACRDWTNKEIARHMGLSVNTVKHYVSDILEKLQIDKREKIKDYVNQ